MIHNNFSEDSRVWVYQSNRNFSEAEINEIEKGLNEFTKSWTAHNNQLKAEGKIFYKRFIVLMVDESHSSASGCSIDKSVKFLKELENHYGINLFNRLEIAYRKTDEIKTSSLSELKNLFQSGEINEETIIFSNAVQTKKELVTNWEAPIKNSWLANKLIPDHVVKGAK